MGEMVVPAAVLCIVGWALLRGVDVYEQFVDGLTDGLKAIVRILPNIMGMTLAVATLNASGLLDAIMTVVQPLCEWLGFPGEVLPLAIMRPISGSGALGILNNIITNMGPDSFAGLLACTMMGSTETTLYTASIYLNAAGIKKTGYVIKAGLFADFVGMVASVIFCKMLF
jgi:spore maturation protein B